MTFMVYLSDIKEGGGGNTVFPLLGLSVPSTMGTALFWNTVKLKVQVKTFNFDFPDKV
jgi:hypothetical protein